MMTIEQMPVLMVAALQNAKDHNSELFMYEGSWYFAGRGWGVVSGPYGSVEEAEEAIVAYIEAL